jgi:hypothetical protein
MKRLSLIVAAALAGVTLAAVLATGGSAQQPGELTFKLVERAGSDRDHFVDNPPRGNQRTMRLSAGDFSTTSTPLYDETNTTRRGTLHIVCLATLGGTIERASFHCTGTAVLREGSLALNFGGRFGQQLVAAVTGGTGAYEGRRGSITPTERPGGKLTDDVVHLLP